MSRRGFFGLVLALSWPRLLTDLPNARWYTALRKRNALRSGEARYRLGWSA